MDALDLFEKLAAERLASVPVAVWPQTLSSIKLEVRRQHAGDRIRHEQPDTKRRISELADQGLSTAVIAGRVGVEPRWVRRVLQQLREVS
jgi:hypothetical protein